MPVARYTPALPFLTHFFTFFSCVAVGKSNTAPSCPLQYEQYHWKPCTVTSITDTNKHNYKPINVILISAFTVVGLFHTLRVCVHTVHLTAVMQ
jgi:hypothetical protein